MRLERHLAVWEDPPQQDDQHALWVADLDFHRIIYRVTGNRHLLGFGQIAGELAAVYRQTTIRRPDDHPDALRSRDTVRDEHRRILEALADRDVDRAETAARHHIENVLAHLDRMEVIADTPL